MANSDFIFADMNRPKSADSETNEPSFSIWSQVTSFLNKPSEPVCHSFWRICVCPHLHSIPFWNDTFKQRRTDSFILQVPEKSRNNVRDPELTSSTKASSDAHENGSGVHNAVTWIFKSAQSTWSLISLINELDFSSAWSAMFLCSVSLTFSDSMIILCRRLLKR